MTSVERFIEIMHWSITRKTAFWAAVLCGWHLLTWVAIYLASRFTEVFNAALVLWVLGLWTIGVALFFLLSYSFLRMGRELPRIVIYVGASAYCFMAVVLIYLFGSATTSLAFIAVTIIFIGTVFFDVSFGAVHAALLLALLLAVGILESYEVLPYAPALAAQWMNFLVMRF